MKKGKIKDIEEVNINTLDDDSDFGTENDSDLGGLYGNSDVVDQNSDNPTAGTPGHPGIDEDTA